MRNFKLIDGRSGGPMGFTFTLKDGENLACEKVDNILLKASMKKNCPIDMIEVKEYRPWKRKVRAAVSDQS